MTALLGPARDDTLHVASYNVRYDRKESRPGEPDHWPEREPLARRFLDTERPTLLGVQEMLFRQIATIEAGLGPAYRMIGQGRQGGSRSEYSAIFYDASRLTLLEWDQFWLSPRPRQIGSAGWGTEIPRVCTWGRFLDTVTGREIAHLNTHVDHRSAKARLHGAEMIRTQIGMMHVPAILTGDFNAPAGGCDSYDVLTGAGLKDTWLTAAERLTPDVGTYLDYTTPVPGGERIDWILTSPAFEVLRAAINTTSEDGRFASDHAQVQALLRLS